MNRGFPRLAEWARRRAPSRREVLKAAAVAGLCGAVSTFAPALPLRSLSSALPVPLIAATPVSVSFSTLALRA